MYRSTLRPNTRIDVADALRGLAVAGIILIHSCEHFNLYWSGLEFDRAAVVWLEKPVERVVWWLCAGKMYTVFALLFGLSFFIQSDNQAQRGRGFSLRFAWRMALLFCIGMINTALYNGDVLVSYSVIGLLLIPLGKLPTRWVAAVAAVLLLQPVELYQWLSGNAIVIEDTWSEPALAAFTGGGLWQTLAANAHYGQQMTLAWYFANGRLTQTLAMFLLGMIAGRLRLFYDEGGNRRVWCGILLAGVAGAVVLQFLPASDIAAARTAMAAWYNFAQTVAAVSLVVIGWYGWKRLPRLLEPFRTFGRMSLTNYLLQSIIGTLLFYNCGLGLFRRVEMVYAAMIGIGMIVAQCLFCRWWLSRHSHGPVEWLWKRLTWIGGR